MGKMGKNGEKTHGEFMSDHVKISLFSPFYAINSSVKVPFDCKTLENMPELNIQNKENNTTFFSQFQAFQLVKIAMYFKVLLLYN